MQIPLIVSSNFHYISTKDKQAFEVALAIKDQRLITDPARRKAVGNRHMMSENEILNIMKDN